MAKQLFVSQDVLWTQQSLVVCFVWTKTDCFVWLSELLRRLRLAKIDRPVILVHAKKKVQNA